MHTLAYDERRARIVLVGGRSNPGGFLGDLWEWDGSTWTPGAGVPAREGSAMAFDRLRGRLVLFGGSNSSGFLRETWERDGTAWTLRSSSTGPLATGPMAYDPARGKVVVASEFQGSLETWEWDGTGWSRPLVSPAPPNFYFASLAQDEQRRRSVLTVFGGTWEYVVPCDVVGLGHAGGGLALTCSTAPRPGTDFCVSFSDPPPRGTGWHLLSVSTGPLRRPALPLASPGTCAPGFLHLLPQLLLTAGGDPAMFCVRLPATPALGGTGFLLQGASLETGACWRMTDALAVTVDG
jgi:hypothetical protein